MKVTRPVCAVGLALAALLVSASCSDRSTPTSMSAIPSTGSTSHGATPSAFGAFGDVRNAGASVQEDPIAPPASQSEQFNCTNVQEVYVRFSDPGYVLDNAVGLHVHMTGMPAGRKLLRIWWDYQNRGELFQDVHIGEGEVQRDDDSLFDYEGLIEHAYQGITAPTDYRVRVEMMIVGKTGNCARVRDVTVTPGNRTTASSTELITNGGFETGDFSGWTKSDAGSGTFYVYSGTTTPLSSHTVLAPPAGGFAAVSDQTGPGSQILYQDVTLPAGATASFSAIVYLENHYTGGYVDAGSLSHGGGANQQMRVDVMNPAAAVDDVGAGVLVSVFKTNPGDPTSIGYTTIGADLSPFAGQTVRIRIAVVETEYFFNGSVDAVSVKATR